MHRYRLYGLNIQSSRRINILDETDFPPERTDLSVDWQIGGAHTPDRTLDWHPVPAQLPEGFDFVSLAEAETENGAFFKICFKTGESGKINCLFDAERKNLSIYHPEKTLAGDLDSLLVGPFLGFTLRLRGIVSLHASAVAVDGRAVVFLGHSTAGKSTLAAGMVRAGAQMLADDISVLVPGDEGRFLVEPGYAKVRLRPRAARFLTGDPDSLPAVYSHRESRYASLGADEKFYPEPLPLAVVYVLGKYDDQYKEPFIKPVSAGDKLINLVQNTTGFYVVRGESRAREFETLAEIAKSVPVRRLFYAHDIETLPAQCQLIFEDFRKIRSGGA